MELGPAQCPSWLPGFLLDFISCPVIKGFTSAATVTIGFGQIKVGMVPTRTLPSDTAGQHRGTQEQDQGPSHCSQ